MGFDGTGLILAVLLLGAWLGTVVVQFALLAARRTSTTDVACWLCLTAQVAMLVRSIQVGLPVVAVVCAVTIAAGLLARRRWAHQRAASTPGPAPA